MEIIQEYKNQVLKQFTIFMKQNKCKSVGKKVFEYNTFVISAATHFGLDDMVESFAKILKSGSYVDFLETIDFVKKSDDISDEEMIIDITQQDKKMLLEK